MVFGFPRKIADPGSGGLGRICRAEVPGGKRSEERHVLPSLAWSVFFRRG